MNKKLMISKLSIPVLCFVGITLLTIGVVLGYVLTGHDWTYQPNPMGENYDVYENCGDCTGELTSIKAAATTWNNACAKFSFSYGTPTTRNAPIYDNYNVIRWGTLSTGILANTTLWFNTTTGDILECDCVFNDNYTWSTATTTPSCHYDVESVMLHEFAHWLSLTCNMPPLACGTQSRTLSTDCKDGIKAIYGSKFFCCSTLGFSNEVVTSVPGQALVNIVLLFSTLIVVPLIRIFKGKK